MKHRDYSPEEIAAEHRRWSAPRERQRQEEKAQRKALEPRCNIYLATSAKNSYRRRFAAQLRIAGHRVYDCGDVAVRWSRIDKQWHRWSAYGFREALDHPFARQAGQAELDARSWADVCILLLPAAAQAHWVAGWFVGQGTPTIVVLHDGIPYVQVRYGEAVCCITFEDVLRQVDELRIRQQAEAGDEACRRCDGLEMRIIGLQEQLQTAEAERFWSGEESTEEAVVAAQMLARSRALDTAEVEARPWPVAEWCPRCSHPFPTVRLCVRPDCGWPNEETP
jgi:hypothetical protein